uniref:Hexosyltransferase n=1 Tax=Ditylenchus dipsaci TaxID=166011 RepID=A0A915E7N4_9BILA
MEFRAILCRNFTKNLCRTTGYFLAKLLGLAFLTLVLFKFSYVVPENKFNLKLEPLKSALQRYSLHFRSPAEENQLKSVPLNWTDIKIGTYPRGICENLNKNGDSATILFDDAKEKFSVQHLFVVAVGNASQILIKEVKSEASKHKDILVIDNIQDHYHKISFKVRAWVAYLAERCASKPSLKYIAKMDDDVMINLPALLHILPTFGNYKNVVCAELFLMDNLLEIISRSGICPKKNINTTVWECIVKGWLSLDGRLVYTHALMNGTGAAYFDIGAHYISTNSRDETKLYLRRDDKSLDGNTKEI